MATITSVGSGLWSAAGTWDAGVPLDGDAVIIASGHTVTFDVDQSAFVTGISLTITGTLTHSIAAGTYCLFAKTGASITGAGTWNIGTQAIPIPFAIKHTITGASGWYVDGIAGLTMSVYAAEPAIEYVRLTADKAIGQTVMAVDTDVTGDIWADTDMVGIADINKTKECEEYTIAAGGIAAGTITLSGAGLTVAKSTGAYLCLITRNVKIVAVGAPTQSIHRVTKLYIGGGLFYGVNKYMLSICDNANISGGVFSYNNIHLYASSSVSISGGVFINGGTVVYNASRHLISGGMFVGNINGFNLLAGASFSDCLVVGNTTVFVSSVSATILSGIFRYNNYVFSTLPSLNIFGGTFSNNAHPLYRVSGKIINAVFENNDRDINQSELVFFNTLLGSVVENQNYTWLTRETYTESFDHDQVAGAFRAWTRGGVTTKQAVVYPTGYDYSYQTVLEDANNEGFWQREISVASGQSVNLDLWLRKDASMTYLPRCSVFLKREIDPFAGGTPIHSFIMTDSVDTWEHDTYTYANDGSADVILVIRTQGKNASGNLFSQMNVEVINVDLTSVLAHLVDIKGASWTVESLASITTLLGTLATSAELAALNDLDPAGIRAAVGLAFANLDQQFLNLVAWQAINLDESITEGTIVQIRGNSWTIAIDDLILSDHKQQFAIKYTHLNAAIKPPSPPWTVAYPDADSLIFIDSDTGLLYLNGVAAADPTLGSLAYVGTTLTVTLDPAVTSLLAPGTYTFGIQSVDALGVVSETYGGTFTITADVVRSIT
jgi:hypothetical protein